MVKNPLPPKTAEELMKCLQNDPNYQAGIATKNFIGKQRAAQIVSTSSPILNDLKNIGIDVYSLDELRTNGKAYKEAIPILISWLKKITDDNVRETLVRALSVPWASDEAESVLIDLYLSLDSAKSQTLKWVVGNALSVISTDRYLDKLLKIVQNKQNGTTRQMVVLGLSNVTDKKVGAVLINLLTDPDVAGHAIIALGKLKIKEAIPEIEPFLNCKTRWIRLEAKKALASIGKT